MADTDSYIKPQRLGSRINQTNPNRFYPHFMYKATIVAIFLVVVPLFSSQAPEFINQTLHNRSWEVVQLLFVGIAVSYGLFSKRNDEAEKEHSSKLDNAHSIVSGFLQVSSVFDDEADIPSGSDDKKLQTWNSQYYREEPVLVVAQENSVHEEQRGTSSRVDEKPLLLPVRSLKSRVSESDVASNSVSKRFSNNPNKPRNGEFRSSSPLDLEEEAEENVVLCSPIPWRSRSEKMDIKVEMKPPPSTEEPKFNRFESRSFRSRTSRSSRPNSTSPSPTKLSPPSLSSPPFSMESQAKNIEELAWKKIHYQFPPPPPPPLPPQRRYVHKPPPAKSNSNPILSNSEIYSVKEVKRSTRSVPTDFSGNGSRPTDGPVIGKSVRTIRGESISGYVNSRELDEDEMSGERRSVISNPGFGGYQKEGTLELAENMVSESEEDQSENEDGVFEQGSNNEEVDSNSVGDGGLDVNKKADEFIAKFREQIRLQRIESIKKSTGYIARSSAR